MKIYSVDTCIILGAYQNPRLERQFGKVIKVPFLPYHFEGKRFDLDFVNNDHKGHLGMPGGSFDVKYVLWSCDGSKSGSWRMCISAKVSEDVFAFYCKIIENDVLHEIPSLD